MIHNIKWLPYSQRCNIWKDSRKRIADQKTKQEEVNHRMMLSVTEDIKHKLEAIGISEEKAVSAVTDRYTYHLRGKDFVSRFH